VKAKANSLLKVTMLATITNMIAIAPITGSLEDRIAFANIYIDIK
jgi:hypothetical protein